MNRKVEAALRTMTRPGDRVICAVSGGRDSMAMLHCIWNLRDTLDIHVTAAHFNHQLRGEESLRDEQFVRDYCADIPLDVGSADVAGYARNNGLGTEEAARILRYDFLQRLDPSAKIATAHTAEDNLETILMHLIRGTTLHGLAGIPPVREDGTIIRPLLTVSRAELAAYSAEHHVPHVEDSTNFSDDCLRNRIRHHVLPLLFRENPNLAASVTNMAQSLRREDECLSELAAPFVGDAIDIHALLRQHEAIRYRVFRQFLSPVPGLTQAHLEAAVRMCRVLSPSAALSLPGGYQLARVYGTLELRRANPMPQPEARPLTPGAFPFGPWHILCQVGTVPEVLPEHTVALVSRDGLQLRTRQPGDRIQLSGGGKKLSRYLIDQKIPAHLRDTLPLVALEQEILAVLPLETAHGLRAQPGSTGLLLTATRMEDF